VLELRDITLGHRKVLPRLRPPCCHLGLGKLYRRADRRLEARDHLTAAAAMYREMDLRFWLEKAEAELRELAS
jgi:hypothetical protein